MTVEHDSSLDSTETAIDSTETSPAGRGRGTTRREGSARVSALAAIRRWTRRCLARWRSIVATVLVVAAVGGRCRFVLHSCTVRIARSTMPRHTGRSRRLQTAPWMLLSYSYDSLDRDFAKAKSHLTGDFLAYYSKFSEAAHRAGGAAGATDDDRQGDSGRRFGVASRFGCRAGVRRPDHGKQAETRTREGRQQRPGHADEGQRFLADREVRPGRMSAANLWFEPLPGRPKRCNVIARKAEIGRKLR